MEKEKAEVLKMEGKADTIIEEEVGNLRDTDFCEAKRR